MIKNVTFMTFGFGNSNKKFANRRGALVDKLRSKGIKDERVLAAIGRVPRHEMIDSALENRAYEDTALPIGKNQTISQPYTVAVQTELMGLSPGERVLEIGSGSGYQSAVLCEIGVDVFTIERVKHLYERARDMLRSMDYNVTIKLGDGTKGWRAYAPYDGIVVTAGAPAIPTELTRQLTIGGQLVVPVGDRDKQKMIRVTRTGEDEFEKESFSHFKFVPLIGEGGWS